MMSGTYQRREMLQLAGATALGSLMGGIPATLTAETKPAGKTKGCVVGQPEAARAGEDVLAAGGNAVDAVAAAALVAGVVAVPMCGIGGYGGHMVIALPGGKKVTAIDFNSTAPAAARADMFPLDKNGAVKGQINTYGWLAAGVPGTLAGIQLALDRYGTQSFRKLVQPAIRYAREGFEVSKAFAGATRTARARFLKDPGSARLLLRKGQLLKAGSTFRNPDLAKMLENLAQRNSVDSFYRGDIARQIAAAFKKHGGLVTAADLAAYRAREVAPLELTWRGYSIRTAPLTAGGATILEALMVLRALGWDKWKEKEFNTDHARLETLRLVWHDRLKHLGDPQKVKVPLKHLLSEEHARDLAARVEKAVKQKKPATAATDGRKANGTIHLSAVDAKGMMVALTLTHGGAFGSQVTVDGLGLILGHGMIRFDPEPGRPNSVGPGKRPLHNMCPTIVLRDGHPILALGGRGGRRIPNAVFDVVLHFVGRDFGLEEAVKAPRMHTEGGMDLTLEGKWPAAELGFFKTMGYRVKKGASAYVSAVAFDPKDGKCRSSAR
jgi:gamma-glutamyltranspeptidase/glutathione hydrolase